MSNRDERDLYYSYDSIKLESRDNLSVFASRWYPRIIDHEINGLKSMGCQVDFGDSWTIVRNVERPVDSYYNRVLDIKGDDRESFVHLLDSLKYESVEITPFTSFRDIEDILQEKCFIHTFSSIVLGKELVRSTEVFKIPYKVKRIDNDSLEASALPIFRSFHKKAGESESTVAERFHNNLERGPHFVILDSDRCVGVGGAIVDGVVASVYAGAIKPSFRGGGVGIRLASEIENELANNGVEFVYYKTRNRAVARGSRIYLGLRHLYNERVYGKKR